MIKIVGGNTKYSRVIYFSFILQRFFGLFKKGGELIALVGQVKESNKEWLNENGASIIDFNVKNWTDTSKKTKEEKKATTISNINLSIIIMNKKDDIGLKEMNMEIDPDLTPKEEKKAIEYDEGITGINNKIDDGFIPKLKDLPNDIKEAIRYLGIGRLEIRPKNHFQKEKEYNKKIIDYFKINNLSKYRKFQEEYEDITLLNLPFL